MREREREREGATINAQHKTKMKKKKTHNAAVTKADPKVPFDPLEREDSTSVYGDDQHRAVLCDFPHN